MPCQSATSLWTYVVILTCLIIHTNSFAIELSIKPLIIGYFHHYPITYTDKDGSADGTTIRQLNALLISLKLPYEFREYPAARLYKEIADGNVNIWCGIKNVTQLKGSVIEGNHPLRSNVINLYSLTPLIKGLGMSMMNGKSVAIIRGYEYAGLSKFIENPLNKIVTVKTLDHETSLKLLLMERTQLLIGYEAPMTELLKTSVKKIHSYKLKETPSYFIISKRTPNAYTLLKSLEHAYKLSKLLRHKTASQ